MTHQDPIAAAIEAHIRLEREAALYRKLRAALCMPRGEVVDIPLEADTPEQFDAIVDSLPGAGSEEQNPHR